MKTFIGNYVKKDGESRKFELYPLVENESYMDGIDLEKLNPNEKEEFIKIVKEYELKLNSFTKKAYRSFIKESIKDMRSEVK